jgi:hypothetical protein
LAGSGADSWSKAPNVLYRNNASGRLDGGSLEILLETVVWKQQRRGGSAGCLADFLLAGLIVLRRSNKKAWTSSISKKSGGGQTVVKVTFFLTDFSVS